MGSCCARTVVDGRRSETGDDLCSTKHQRSAADEEDDNDAVGTTEESTERSVIKHGHSVEGQCSVIKHGCSLVEGQPAVCGSSPDCEHACVTASCCGLRCVIIGGGTSSRVSSSSCCSSCSSHSATPCGRCADRRAHCDQSIKRTVGRRADRHIIINSGTEGEGVQVTTSACLYNNTYNNSNNTLTSPPNAPPQSQVYNNNSNQLTTAGFTSDSSQQQQQQQQHHQQQQPQEDHNTYRYNTTNNHHHHTHLTTQHHTTNSSANTLNKTSVPVNNTTHNSTTVITGSLTQPHTMSVAYGASAVCTLATHTSDVNGVAFGTGLLASCGGDKTVKVYNVEDFTELGYSPLQGHRYSVNGCTFSPTNRVLASYSTDGRAVLWDLKTGEQLAVLTHPSQASIKVCVFSPSGDILATGSDDESLCLWDIASKRIIRSFSGQESSIQACAFSPCSAFIVAGNVDGYLKVFDTSGRVTSHLFFEMNAHDLGVTCAAFSPSYGTADGNSCVLVSLPSHLLPDTQEEEGEGEEAAAEAQEATEESVTGARFSADAPKVHYLLVTCGYDNTLKLWDFVAYEHSVKVKLTLRNTLTGHNDSVMCCTFSPNGQLLASAAGDKTVRLWDPIQGQHLYTILGHSRFVTCCAFSLDGAFLASGSNDRDVKIWRVMRVNQHTGEPKDPMMDGPCSVPVTAPERHELSGAGIVPGAVGHQPGGLDTAYYMKDLADWGVDEVSQWLSDLGMPQYVPQFRQHAIDGTELITLTADTLEKDFNITVLGHRNKLARTIQDLKDLPHRQLKAAANGVPDEFLCPITREIMSDPVIAADGFTYERQAICDWMKRGKMYSPMTNATLTSPTLTPNRSVKMLIERQLQQA